ncbi:phosphoglucomutase [Treponema sp.]
MALLRHPTTGKPLGDPDYIALSKIEQRPNKEEMEKALASLILSASGWRTVFASDGNEESRGTAISPAHELIALGAASVFASYLKKQSGLAQPCIVLGMDSRPTGPAIADLMARAFLAEGCLVQYLYIAAAPEIMAYARSAGMAGAVHGFAYVSASHNPIGHNGLKFGLIDGGVLTGSEAAALIAAFKALMETKNCVEQLASLVAKVERKAILQVYEGCVANKKLAHTAYLLFTREIVTGYQELADQDRVLDSLAEELAQKPISIVADFNGSARSLALDVDFLSSLGAKIDVLNGEVGNIAHRIVPEGESLETCRLHLEKLHSSDPSFVLGYVPDCDGDRGNLVIWDEKAQGARSLEAQEVFALACMAELAHLVWTGDLSYDPKGKAKTKVAIAINDPSSLRVDRIAKAFDVSVFRAEVGEANVVGLARQLREKGYLVRFLGEGAAGGVITHPSAVRDPIDTVFALLKILAIRSKPEKEGLFEIYKKRIGQGDSYSDSFTLSDIISSLPAFVTTSAYVKEAGLKIKSKNQAELKSEYKTIFLQDWETRKEELEKRFGIVSWEALTYNGLVERPIDHFEESDRGGLKIQFADKKSLAIAFIWMRGSGTEPIFRIMADAEGSDERFERYLLQWQASMIEEADNRVIRKVNA